MKHTVRLLLCGTLCGLLSACGGPQAAETAVLPAPTAAVTPAPTRTPEPTPEPPQMSMLTEENAPARAAYAAALKNLLDANILPDGTDHSEGYIGSIEQREAMAVNQFAVYDVDGDGREELILLYTTDNMASMSGFIYDWDAETGELRMQLKGFPAFTFYESGAVKVGWSHNQGKGGDFWPYDLYRYEMSTDSSVEVGSVDAWDKSHWPEDYPSEIDTSGTGFVYYISTVGDVSLYHLVDAEQYQAWLSPYLGEAEELSIPYLALTAENIHFLQTPG